MSADDVSANWRHIPHRVIPPIMYAGPEAGHPEAPVPQTRDVLFVGSLDVPHAVAGLEWFLRLAWPRIRAGAPGARFVVAGRRPSPRLIRAVDETPGVLLVPDPEILDDVFAEARIFVNPVFAGSGVNLKLGEPMRRAVPVVTTTVGVRGLGVMDGGFAVSDTPEGFSKACLDLLHRDDLWSRARAGLLAARGPYSATAVGQAIATAILGQAQQRAGR
jgi:glycosyltransferase involved in cell wall biosynthesis